MIKLHNIKQMTKPLLHWIWGCLLLCAPLCISAQNITVSARIDSTIIPIGDQTNLTFEIAQLAGEHVACPIFSDTIIDKIEIVNYTTDTLDLGSDRIQISQKYVITSFDDSLYYIPSMPFATENETIYSNGLSLNVVQPFEIDTTNQAITDIKDVYKAPIYWWGIIRIVLLVLLVIGLGVLGYFLYKKFKTHKGESIFEKAEPVRPAYEIALEQLDKIKAEKVWQQHGRQKEYQTELTSVLRAYIERTYGIGSMEMTSVEILSALKLELKDQKEVYGGLKQILSLADLVKFAKWSAMPNENELSLNNAYMFVHETMPKEIIDTPNDEQKVD